jgi:hypothetical protein
MPNLLQVEDVGSGSQACLIWLSKFQRLLANINALGQTGQVLKSKNKAAKNGRESTCVSDFQNPKDEDSCLELDMMSVYMKFLERLFWLFLSTPYLWDLYGTPLLLSLLAHKPIAVTW